MTIARGSKILAKDVESLVNTNYPEYSSYIDPGGMKGHKFDASGAQGYGGAQNFAVALALIATGLPTRSKSNITIGPFSYVWQSEAVVAGEITGTKVLAANFWQQVQAAGSTLNSQSRALALLDSSANPLGEIIASFQTQNDAFSGFGLYDWTVKYNGTGAAETDHSGTVSPPNASFSDSFTYTSPKGNTATLMFALVDNGDGTTTGTWSVSTSGSVGGSTNPFVSSSPGIIGTGTVTWSIGFSSPSENVNVSVGVLNNGVGDQQNVITVILMAGRK